MMAEKEIRTSIHRTEEKKRKAFTKMKSLGTHKKNGEIATHTVEYFVFEGAIKAFKKVLGEDGEPDLKKEILKVFK